MGEAENTGIVPVEAVRGLSIKSLIYVVRGQQVMLDRDLAELYGVENKRLNENVKRNANRFPEEFCFQLTAEENENLKSQFATSSSDVGTHGGRRKLPYVFTEQGIAMLSAVLRSDTAVAVSIQIMNAFVEMRRFLASNAAMFEQVRSIELHQLELRREVEDNRRDSDEKFERLFGLLEAHEEPSQYIFFGGQMYDAFEFLADLVGRAEREIVLVDGYVDLGTLNILKKKRKGVAVTVWAKKKGDKLTDGDIVTFKAQYKPFELKHTEAFHDRYLILDGKIGYHIGASIKDAGKKCFGINLMQDEAMVESVLEKLEPRA